MAQNDTAARLPPNLALVGLSFVGLLFAIVLGTLIGSDESKQLLGLVAAAFGILFVVKLHRYVWQMALFLIFLSFQYRPTNFAFGPLELSCGLGFALAAIFVWQKRPVDRPSALSYQAFPFMQMAVFIWLVYLGLHMVYNFNSPYRPGEFSSTNAIKSYFGMAAPFLLLLYFARNPTGLVVKQNAFWTISRLCLFGLILNLAFRGYELATYRAVYIPGINATSNGYALRTLAPVAMLLAAAALASAKASQLSSLRRLTYWMLLVLGAGGALVSGGRVTIIYSFLAVCVALWFRRKFGLLMVVFAVGVLGLIAAQLSSSWINTQANPFFRRSVQLVLVEKNYDTLEAMESSTNWRWELAMRALNEWQSNPRIFWFGRATFGYGAQDERSIMMFGGYEALIRTALRRGATHNLVTDLLVTYGIIGTILYFVAFISIIRFLWTVRKRQRLSELASNLALVCVLLALLTLALELAGIGSVRIELVWLTVILIASFYSGSGVNRALAPLPVVRNEITPQVRLGHRRFARPALR